jgi:hypothetical protein
LRLRFVSVVTLLILFLTSSVSLLAQEDQPATCPGALPARLTVGGAARVTPGAANNVRRQPDADSALVTRIPGGELFFVVDGPACDEAGRTWWQVETADYDYETGWTVEATPDEYRVEPVESALISPDVITFDQVLEFSSGVMVEVFPALYLVEIALPQHVEYQFEDYPYDHLGGANIAVYSARFIEENNDSLSFFDRLRVFLDTRRVNVTENQISRQI